MSENLDRGRKDFSKYDAMSTEELKEILRLDAESPEEQESDAELLFYVMGVLADRRNHTQFTGKTAREEYESFKQHYLPCEDHVGSVPAGKRAPIRWFRPLTAAAAALVIVAGLSISARAFNWNIWNVVAQWAKETFSFVGDEGQMSEPGTDDTVEYRSLQDALERNYKRTDIVPTWFPEGYQLGSIEIDTTPLQETFISLYYHGDKVLKITVASYLNREPEFIEQSSDFIEIYPVDGIDYYLFSNNTRNLSAWIVDSYECRISGELTIDEMKAMIDSIGKG